METKLTPPARIPVLDPAALEHLIAIDPEGELELVPRLIEMFLKGTPLDLERIEAEAADSRSVSEHVHRMKSGAATLGLGRMVELYRAYEIGQYGPARVRLFARALRVEFGRARAELNRFRRN